jgi:hypothetical protein
MIRLDAYLDVWWEAVSKKTRRRPTRDSRSILPKISRGDCEVNFTDLAECAGTSGPLDQW